MSQSRKEKRKKTSDRQRRAQTTVSLLLPRSPCLSPARPRQSAQSAGLNGEQTTGQDRTGQDSKPTADTEHLLPSLLLSLSLSLTHTPPTLASTTITMAQYDHLLPAPYEIPGPTSPQSSLLGSSQRYLVFPRFVLESGVTLNNVPVAFKTWGTLDPVEANNALVVCHALTGSADVEDWWGPLLGPGKLFDPTRFLVICCNVLGSPYGSGSPCTTAGGEDDWLATDDSMEHKSKQRAAWDGRGWWGPEFPATTPRDDARIHKLVLDYLGVRSIAAVVGGSMGGMTVLEWPLCFPTRYPHAHYSHANSTSSSTPSPYIRAIVPIATSARHSAWCISWAEAQRQSIYSDPAFKHGYYPPAEPPASGLSAARMAALLTYRSRDSFESRFGRRIGKPLKAGAANGIPNPSEESKAKSIDEQRRRSLAQEAALAHNEGNKSPPPPPVTPSPLLATTFEQDQQRHQSTQAQGQEQGQAKGSGAGLIEAYSPSSLNPQIFSAQSYLRYQGDKFVKRFDANCYIHLTRKMDAHDVAKNRWGWVPGPGGARQVGVAPTSEEEEDDALARVLATLSTGDSGPAVLVVSIESDGLFAPPEQKLLHTLIPHSQFVNVVSPDGHDGFLLEFQQINTAVGAFLRQSIPDIYSKTPNPTPDVATQDKSDAPVKESVFGEVEDVSRW